MAAPLPPVPPGPISTDPSWPQWFNLLRAFVTSGYVADAGTAETAGTAESVDWTGVQNTPTTLPGYGVSAVTGLPISNCSIGYPTPAGAAFTGLQLTEGGSTAALGVATLVAGQVIVTSSIVTANSRIFLTLQQDGLTGTPGTPRVSSRDLVLGNFTITSSSPTDTSTVAFVILQPVTP